jgi:hypothetical protein
MTGEGPAGRQSSSISNANHWWPHCTTRRIDYSIDNNCDRIPREGAGSADRIEQVVEQQQLGDRQWLTAGAVTDVT